MVKKRIWWLLVIACMVMIFLFSHQEASKSTDLSDGILFDIIDFLKIEVSTKTLGFLSVFIRKCAHFSVYGLLGFLVSNLVRENYGLDGKIGFAVTLGVCALYAVSDEIHQLFVLGRSGEIRDVLIDSVGAMAGIAIAFCIKRLSVRRNKND